MRFLYVVFFAFLSFTCFPVIANSNAFELIENLRNKGNLDEADVLAKELLSSSVSLADSSNKADALYQLGRNSMERNLYPPAKQYFEEALLLYQDLNSQRKIAESYRQIGLTYRYMVQYDRALTNIYRSMEIYERLDNERDMASIYNSAGVVLEKVGQYNEAVAYHQRALEINYQLKDQGGIASALYNLGDIRRSMGDLELALDYFNDALKIDEALADPKNIAYSRYKIGLVQKDLGNYSLAKEHMTAAHQIFSDIQAKRDTDWALSGLAMLAHKEGRLQEAQEIIEGVIERTKAGSYLSLLSDAHRIFAQILFAQQKYLQANEQIGLAIAQAKKNDEQQKLAFYYKLQMQIAESMQDLGLAYESLKQQKLIDDELMSQQRLTSIANLQAQTEFIRRANQIELLEKERVLQASELQQEKSARLFSFGIIALASLLLFLVYSRYLQAKLNSRLQREVEERTNELKQSNSKLEAANARLEMLSVTDKLTGLKNRRFFADNIEYDIKKSMREYTEARKLKKPSFNNNDICFFAVDIDHFKAINDKHGHNIGDHVLVEFSKRLSEVFRESDYLIRWGGEEFVGVARFVNREEAASIAERIRHSINQNTFLREQKIEFKLSCSIGFSCFPLDPDNASLTSFDEMVEIADSCLYAAKNAGRNAWVGISKLPNGVQTKLPKNHVQLSAFASEHSIQLENSASIN